MNANFGARLVSVLARLSRWLFPQYTYIDVGECPHCNGSGLDRDGPPALGCGWDCDMGRVIERRRVPVGDGS